MKILRQFLTPYRAAGFLGDCDETFDTKRKFCMCNCYVRSAKPGILEKIGKIARVEGIGVSICCRPQTPHHDLMQKHTATSNLAAEVAASVRALEQKIASLKT